MSNKFSSYFSILLAGCLCLTISANPSHSPVSEETNCCSSSNNDAIQVKRTGGDWSECNSSISGPECLKSGEDGTYFANIENSLPESCNSGIEDVKWTTAFDEYILVVDNGLSFEVNLTDEVPKQGVEGSVIASHPCCGRAEKDVTLVSERSEQEQVCERISLDADIGFALSTGVLCYTVDRSDCTVSVGGESFTRDFMSQISPMEVIDQLASLGIPVDLGSVDTSVLEADFVFDVDPSLIDERQDVSRGCCPESTRTVRRKRFDVNLVTVLNTCPGICTELTRTEPSIVGREIRNVSSKCCQQ